MTSDEIYIGDKVDEVFRRNEYDAHPDEIGHDVELRGNYLYGGRFAKRNARYRRLAKRAVYVEFHEPPKWKQREDGDD